MPGLRDLKGSFKTSNPEIISIENPIGDYHVITLRKPEGISWRPGEHAVFTIKRRDIRSSKYGDTEASEHRLSSRGWRDQARHQDSGAAGAAQRIQEALRGCRGRGYTCAGRSAGSCCVTPPPRS
eukprot:gnl/Dysnectes_brevis/6895_a11046_271.p3 GENE.gnl/Dysnectes_brevis/6895_a11046_271~~gnl/Dysnectes_brevis/6895_a11046_271.p3  ORF type:complete len:125 (-),score=14.60 gnl/Dysnectes_brevis/6895_a11046_271:187-561(-)